MESAFIHIGEGMFEPTLLDSGWGAKYPHCHGPWHWKYIQKYKMSNRPWL